MTPHTTPQCPISHKFSHQLTSGSQTQSRGPRGALYGGGKKYIFCECKLNMLKIIFLCKNCCFVSETGPILLHENKTVKKLFLLMLGQDTFVHFLFGRISPHRPYRGMYHRLK